jgi:hypothetical protein
MADLIFDFSEKVRDGDICVAISCAEKAKRARKLKDDDRKAESDRILRNVHRDSDVVGASALARSIEQVGDHFAARDADQKDFADLWGTRIARAASLIAFIVLAIWLVSYLTR